MTYEERVAEYERERAEAKDQKCGQIAFRGVVVWEGNAVSGSILVPGTVLQPPEDEVEKTPVGGWSARQAGVPEKARPRSKETMAILPRRR